MASKQKHVEDVILFHGPPVCGKTSYYLKYLSESHVRISAEEYFCRNPDFGLRDVVREVIQFLKQGKKVVVDDTNSSRKTRKSYIQLIKSKWKQAKICILCILPKYGLYQLQWSRLYREASHDDIETKIDNEHKTYNAAAMETKIKAWFCDDNPTSVTYSHPEVNQPTESEEVEIQKHESNLQAHSPYKFEVPVLCLQWEGLLKDSCDDVILNCGVAKICKIWHKNNPCGRVIIICDGKQNYSGINATKETIQQLMTLLMRGLDVCPVYVFHVEDLGSSGCYTSPPDPGILAYLQQRHLLDLHHTRSLYLFHTNAHVKMAEAAGMQHVKMGRVLQHPNLIESGHAALCPNIPDFLQRVEVCQNSRSQSVLNQLPTIPLYQDMADFTSNRVSKILRYGRVEYLFANDVDVINRYQSLYAENATKVSETGSRIAAMTGVISSQIDKIATELKTQSPVPLVSTFSDRDLPKWMLGKSDSRQSVASLERMESSDSTFIQGRTRLKQTVYVMTEQELVDTAKQVLLQAGREDIINRVLEAEIENSVNKRKTIAMTCESTLIPDPKLAIKAEYDNTTSVNEERKHKLKGDHLSGNLTFQSPEQVDRTQSSEQVEKTEAAEILDSLFGGETQRKKSPRTRRVKESHLEECLDLTSGTKIMETITTIPETTALEQHDHGKESITEHPMSDLNSLLYSEHKPHKKKAATAILDDLFS